MISLQLANIQYIMEEWLSIILNSKDTQPDNWRLGNTKILDTT